MTSLIELGKDIVLNDECEMEQCAEKADYICHSHSNIICKTCKEMRHFCCENSELHHPK